jgi:hypothetical protein
MHLRDHKSHMTVSVRLAILLRDLVKLMKRCRSGSFYRSVVIGPRLPHSSEL